MWFWHKSPREDEFQKKEAQIQALHDATMKDIDASSEKIMKATEKTVKLNDFLTKEDGGVTELIFYATGGDRRK